MANSLPRVELKLNEENELSFRLSIEGASSLDSKPVYRFVMTESDTDRGWIFPGHADGDSLVNVSIPPLKETFSPQKRYLGKLEVIVGPHYFNPTEILLQFNQPFNVSAVSVTKKGNGKTAGKPVPVVKEDHLGPKVVSGKMVSAKNKTPPEEQENLGIDIPEKEDIDTSKVLSAPEEPDWGEEDDDSIWLDLDSVIAPERGPEASRMPSKASKPISPAEAQAFSKVAFTEPPHASPEVRTASPEIDPGKVLPSAQNKQELTSEQTRLKNMLKSQMKKALMNERAKEKARTPIPTKKAPPSSNLKKLFDALGDD